MYEGEHTAKYVGRHVAIEYACQKFGIKEGDGCVLTCCRLSAVRKSEGELRLTDVLPAAKHLAYLKCCA